MEEDLPQIRAVELRNAIIAASDFYGSDGGFATVSALPEDHFDADGPVGPIGFEVAEGRLFVIVTCLVDWPESGREADAIDSLSRLVTPLLASGRSELVDVKVSDSWSSPIHLAINLQVSAPWRGKIIGELYRHAESILELCEAFATSTVTRQSVADLVRGGGAHLLIGQPEGNWLDAKAEEYDLTTTRGKISLAQAVARFANAEDGGLIVIGAKAKKVPGGEVIRQVRGVLPRRPVTAALYMRVLDQHLYPPAYGLRIDIVPTSETLALILLDIPPQPEEQKPFLVHGAITADGDTEGSFISIVQRRGEASIPITAPMIHASIAAGRALLRGSRPEQN